MICGNDIIVFANDWSGDPLSKKHIVQRFAKRNRVLWVNSLGNRNPTASMRDLRRAAAAGLPVVSSPLPEALKYSNMLRIAGTPAEFLRPIDDCLHQGTCGPRMPVSRLMDNESWDRRVEELSEQIEALSRGDGWIARSVA